MSDEDTVVREHGPEMAALRKLAYGLGDVDDDASLFEAVDAALERIDDLEAETAELQGAVDTDLHFREWKEMTKKDKVRRIQAELVESAQETQNGKDSMDYQDVIWLFNNRPSAGHVYNLMEVAAEGEGFTYEQAGNGQNNRLLVDLNAVKTDAVFQRLNKEEEGQHA